MQEDNKDENKRNRRIKNLFEKVTDIEIADEFDILLVRGNDNDLYNQE